jgi:hypothetical protein
MMRSEVQYLLLAIAAVTYVSFHLYRLRKEHRRIECRVIKLESDMSRAVKAAEAASEDRDRAEVTSIVDERLGKERDDVGGCTGTAGAASSPTCATDAIGDAPPSEAPDDVIGSPAVPSAASCAGHQPRAKAKGRPRESGAAV